MRFGANARMFRSIVRLRGQAAGQSADPRGQTYGYPRSPLPSKRPENVRRNARRPHARVTPPGVPTGRRDLRMHKRKLLIGLATAGLLLAGFGAATMPASAEQRTLLVTLVGGAQVTVTVDVPPGTPTDQIQIPGVSAPIVERPGHHARAARAGARADAHAARPGAGRPQRRPERQPPAPRRAAVAVVHVARRPRQRRPPRRTTPTPSRAAGRPQAAAGDHGQGRARLKLRLMLPRRPRTTRRRRPRTRADKAMRTPGCAARRQPTLGNPTLSEALPGPAPIGVPNFFIDKFRIPPFLLPIYQAAGIEYGVRWEILAAINEIETDYGRNLNVSTAGAVGWMQFMPSTWKRYGVDANHDGRKDPVQPGRRDLRRRALSEGRAGRPGRPPRGLRLQPRRLVRRLGPHARASDRRAARRPRRARSPG